MRLGSQHLAELHEVLDDAVVDNRDIAGDLGMRVPDGRLSVGCPAGVGNAQGPVNLLLSNEIRQLLHLSDASLALQNASGDNGNARGVVAAVFKPPKPLNQDTSNIAL